jgi:hypothetical protein
MSRILRRPLFRGGSVDSRGTGITSGLTEEPRVKAQQGLFIGMDPRYSGFGTQPMLTSEDLIRSYTPSGVPQSLQDLYQSNISQRVDGSRFPITEEYKDKQFEPIASISDDVPIVEKQDEEINEGSISIPNKETRTTDEKSKPELTEAQKYDELSKQLGVSEKDDTEINLEDIFAERLKSAKRSDIADILLGASEGFLEEGTLMGGAKGAVRAGRRPGKQELLKDQITNLEAQMKVSGVAGKRKLAGEIKKLKAMAELGLGKKGQQTNLSRAIQILEEPGLYSPEIVSAAKRAVGGFGSLSEAYMETKKSLGSVSSSDFLNLVRQTESGFNESNIIPSGTDVESLVSQGLDDGIYVVDGEKRVIEISDGKKVRDVKF